MKYKFWVYQMPFLSSRKKLLLLKNNLEEVYHMSKMEWEKFNFLTEKEKEGIEWFRKNYFAEAEWEKMQEKGIRFTCFDSKDYPKSLLSIPNPPYGLTYYGSLPKDNEKTGAIIGARSCSAYGVHTAKQFSAALSRNNIGIVSGMAMGIDGIAQQEALKQEGASYAVLGCGADICYPKQNYMLYEALKEKGGVLSEYPLQTKPQAYLFPPRNRIISGLSEFVLVIEAKEKSGTLITVDMALEQGRDVYVVTGRITDELSRGCNALAKQGAGIANSPAELLCEVMHGKGERKGDKKKEILLGEEEKMVFQQLDFMPKTVEEIFQEIQNNKGIKIEMKTLMKCLTELEMKEIIKRNAGAYFLSEN